MTIVPQASISLDLSIVAGHFEGREKPAQIDVVNEELQVENDGPWRGRKGRPLIQEEEDCRQR